MADDLSPPSGGAAAFEGDATGIVVVVAGVSVADFAVGVKDVLVDDGFGTPFPFA